MSVNSGQDQRVGGRSKGAGDTQDFTPRPICRGQGEGEKAGGLDEPGDLKDRVCQERLVFVPGKGFDGASSVLGSVAICTACWKNLTPFPSP